MMRWFWKLTSGRPMNCRGFAFVGGVVKSVFYWIDRLGRSWVARGPRAWFRVKKMPPLPVSSCGGRGKLGTRWIFWSDVLLEVGPALALGIIALLLLGVIFLVWFWWELRGA